MTERNAAGRIAAHNFPMQDISQKLADVKQRIAESETRIAEHQDRIRTGSCDEVADAAFQLYSALSTVRELRAYKARLESLAQAEDAPNPKCPDTKQ